MKVKVLFFASLSELTGTSEIELENISGTDLLMGYLSNKFPHLKNKVFRVAVNKKLINEDVKLKDGDIVALLPPFAGG